MRGVMLALPLLLLIAMTPAAQSQTGKRLQLVVQTGHGGAVSALALSPDGRHALSGGYDRTILLWELETGKMVRAFRGHELAVRELAFSPDGRRALSLSENGSMSLWDVGSGARVRAVNERTGVSNRMALNVALSPDGAQALTGGYETLDLWNLETGKLLKTLPGHVDCAVTSVAMAPDGRRAISGGRDGSVKVWDLSTGKMLKALKGHTGAVSRIAVSSDGVHALTGSGDGTMRLWDIAAGTQAKLFPGYADRLGLIRFSADGKLALAGSGARAVRQWDLRKGEAAGSAVELPGEFSCAALLPGGQGALIARLDGTLALFDFDKKRIVVTCAPCARPVDSAAFTPDGRYALIAGGDGTVKVWDIERGREVRRLPGYSAPGAIAVFSDGKRVIYPASGRKLVIREIETGTEERVLEGAGSVFALSPDGATVLCGGEQKSLGVFDVATGKSIRTLAPLEAPAVAAAFLPGTREALSVDGRSWLTLWDLDTGNAVRRWQSPFMVHGIALSPDGRHVLADVGVGTSVWELPSGASAGFFGHNDKAPAAFSPDGKRVVFGNGDGTLTVENAPKGGGARTFGGHGGRVSCVAFSPDGAFILSGSPDCSVKLWDTASGRELATLVSLEKRDWAVVAPDGRFDASAGGMRLMHWVTGTEIIDLGQLKERYYEPGLLAKLLGRSTDPLRKVAALGGRSVGLCPEVEAGLAVSESGSELLLKVSLRNRGGGIGRVQVLVNDAEICEDARSASVKPSDAAAELFVPLAGVPFIAGEENLIKVVAWNGEGSLSSRGTLVPYHVFAYKTFSRPHLWIIAGGISRYGDGSLRLRFAAKDAEDMAGALVMGARRLFGATNVHATILSTSGKPGTIPPTKQNFRKAFEDAQASHADDIIVVYLAGHGLSLVRERDLYCYLTGEANSADPAALAAPGVLDSAAITSEELVEWIRSVPANKKVMILDTCAAGAAASALLAKRSVPSDQIRAIERLKDRTGFHVLMGCASDAVSYEASQYGQGLLTYTLLQGMRGAALRDEKYVDVTRLFQYSADSVPRLARNLGGIQSPAVAAPEGTSFDVGFLEEEDKAAIPLASVKPIVLRPMIINVDADEDDLKLTAAVTRRLKEASFDDPDQPFVYVDADELPGAVRPTGKYRIDGDAVKVTMKLRSADAVVSFTVDGARGSVDAVAAVIVERIVEECLKM